MISTDVILSILTSAIGTGCLFVFQGIRTDIARLEKRKAEQDALTISRERIRANEDHIGKLYSALRDAVADMNETHRQIMTAINDNHAEVLRALSKKVDR